MAFVKPRGNGRFTAVYQTPDGKERSAGTYDDEDTAFRVAHQQEAYVRTGSVGLDPLTKATMTIEDYWPTWLKNHRVQPSTRLGYESVLHEHIVPRFGKVRVGELQRLTVRSFLTDLSDAGASPSLQRHTRACLSAMMQTAWDDGYRTDNPVKGLKIDKAKQPDIIVMTREQFGEVYELLPTGATQTFANFIVSTGCRFGEAAALLVGDLNFTEGTVIFNKALQDVGRKHNPDGKSRFHIGPTKTGDPRMISVDEDLLAELQEWITEHNLSAGDLLFPRSIVAPRQRRQRQVKVDLTPELVATLGTKTAKNGREYQHGTWQCYITAKCRDCVHCCQAFSDYRYELEQRKGTRGHASDAATPSDRFYDESDFLYDSRWAVIWQAACRKSSLTFVPTAYQLRHTHASWAIEDGENVKDVMDRLGHKDLTTTTRYIKKVGAGRKVAETMAKKRTWGKKAA